MAMEVWSTYYRLPSSYFEDKQTALDRKDKHEKERQQSIINYGNLVFGNVSGSTLTVDNSIHQIEQAIDEKGGEDKQELHELLDEVKELIENIQSSRAIPKQKKLFEKISNHMEKHGWFYGAVVQLLGTAALGLIGGRKYEKGRFTHSHSCDCK